MMLPLKYHACMYTIILIASLSALTTSAIWPVTNSVFSISWLNFFPSCIDGPEVTPANSSTHFIALGKELRLQCGYAGVPAPTVQWFHDSILLKSGSDGVIIIDGNIGDNKYTFIKVNSFYHADEGTYTCRANTSLGSEEAIYTVQIGMA